jgi:Secretion system C-terminal sorting domain
MKLHDSCVKGLLIVSSFLFLSGILQAQSPGLIVRPAGTAGPMVLNPNQDVFTSATSGGFTTSDITQSEILYKIIKPIMAEPTGDLATGPDGGYSDIVKTVDNSGCYVYNDGTNLLFRLRIGSIVSGAKAYNILIDTDLRLGASGSAADPNYVAPTNSGNGNPGFELEVALETGTNGRVAIYNVDGIVNPTASNTYSLATNQLISVALSRESGNADYFYDFFVPISALGISASTPIRMVISTNTNPGSAFQGTRSDIYGLNDDNFNNTTDAWKFVGENTPGFTLNDVTSGGTGPANVCTAAPTVNTGIASGSNINITGTWTRIDASKPSTATISVYKNGVLAGTTTATSGTPWSYIITTVASGDIITAKAQSTGESMCLTSNSVAVTSCSPANLSSTTNAAFGTCVNNRRGMSGTKTSNAVIKIYSIAAAAAPVLVATDGSPSSPSTFLITYGSPSNVTNTTWEYNGANNSGSTDPCSGGPNDIADGSYYITITESGKCESAPIWGSCVNATQTAAPTITQTTVYSSTTTISGTAAANSTVRLFVNGFLVATTSATAGGAYSFNNQAFQAADVITVRAQSTGQCISNAASVTATCFTAPPVISTDVQGNLTAGATTVTGTSSEPAGTTIRVYNGSNVLQGSSTVQANGTWSVTVAALVNSTVYYATAQNGIGSVSANSSSATARTATTVCPTITGSYTEGNTSVSGTITGPFTGTVYLYQDGGLIGTASLTAQSAWTITVLASNPLYAGGVLTVGAQATNSTLNTACGSTTTVSCSAPSTPLISPTSSSIAVGQTVTYTVSNTQSGVLYIVEDAGSGSSYATSEFGNGGAETITTQTFTSAGVYNIEIVADKLSGSGCLSVATASITVSGSLPVQLLSFNGRLVNAQSHLSWRTATEVNASHYLVERSGDGINFLSIGSVKAIGNSVAETNYQFVDASPLAAFNYYRLKMVDEDGQSSYSAVIKLYSNSSAKVIASPNPFDQVINIQATVEESGAAYIRLFDQQGRIVYNAIRSVLKGTNAIQLNNLPQLPAGNYLLEVRSGQLKSSQLLLKK